MRSPYHLCMEDSWLKRVVHAVCGMVAGAALVFFIVVPESKSDLFLCLIGGGVVGAVLAGLYLDRLWDWRL